MTCDWIYFSQSGHPLWHSINRVKPNCFSNKFEKGNNPHQFVFFQFFPFPPLFFNPSAESLAHVSIWSCSFFGMIAHRKTGQRKTPQFLLKSACLSKFQTANRTWHIWSISRDPLSPTELRVQSGQGQPRWREQVPITARLARLVIAPALLGFVPACKYD